MQSFPQLLSCLHLLTPSYQFVPEVQNPVLGTVPGRGTRGSKEPLLRARTSGPNVSSAAALPSFHGSALSS